MKKTLIVVISLVWFLALHLTSFTVEVSQAQVTVTITPAQADVLVNLTQQFTATVSGTPDQSVTWSLVPGGNGTFGPGSIDATGLYTAGSDAPEPPFVTVKATSVADPSAAGTSQVIVRDLQNYTQSNANGDLHAYNGRNYIQFSWIDLPAGTTKIVLSRSPAEAGPWTVVLISEHALDVTSFGSIVHTDTDLVLLDAANDYFYKLEAFSATGLLLKSYAPVFIPKVVEPLY